MSEINVSGLYISALGLKESEVLNQPISKVSNEPNSFYNTNLGGNLTDSLSLEEMTLNDKNGDGVLTEEEFLKNFSEENKSQAKSLYSSYLKTQEALLTVTTSSSGQIVTSRTNPNQQYTYNYNDITKSYVDSQNNVFQKDSKTIVVDAYGQRTVTYTANNVEYSSKYDANGKLMHRESKDLINGVQINKRYENGELVGQSNTDKYGNLFSITQYSKDEQGLLVGKVQYATGATADLFFDNEGRIVKKVLNKSSIMPLVNNNFDCVETTNYTYNEIGALVESTTKSSNGLTSTSLFDTAKDSSAYGKVIMTKKITDDGTINTRVIYKYDDSGILQETFREDENTKAQKFTLYDNDKNSASFGEALKVVNLMINADGTTSYKTQNNSYDLNGLLIKTETAKDDGTLTIKSEEVIDEKVLDNDMATKQITKKVTTRTNKSDEVKTYIVEEAKDSSNNVWSSTTKDENGNVISQTKYLYDTMGEIIATVTQKQKDEKIFIIHGTYIDAIKTADTSYPSIPNETISYFGYYSTPDCNPDSVIRYDSLGNIITN